MNPLEKLKQCEYAEDDCVFANSQLFLCNFQHYCRSQIHYSNIMYCARELNRQQELEPAGMLETAVIEQRGRVHITHTRKKHDFERFGFR